MYIDTEGVAEVIEEIEESIKYINKAIDDLSFRGSTRIIR